jgi:hypothetical protein
MDHVAARRVAMSLAARPQQPDFARGLARFIQTGAITQVLKTQIRVRARGTSADQPEAARLMEYCISRATDLGPVGENFGRACDQIDRTEAMMTRLQEQARHSAGDPAHVVRGAGRAPVTALAGRDPVTRTVSLILDEETASIAMFAVAAHAEEREAHAREVQRYGQGLPEGSYGRGNREAIAAGEARVAARLRAVERAYQTAMERDTEPLRSRSAAAPRSHQPAVGREIELE